MAFGRLKNMFTPEKANTDIKEFSTEEFDNFLKERIPGSGYERIINLKNGIKMSSRRVTPHDEALIRKIINISSKAVRVEKPNLFKNQLDTYIRTGEVPGPKEPYNTEGDIMRLDQAQRVV